MSLNKVSTEKYTKTTTYNSEKIYPNGYYIPVGYEIDRFDFPDVDELCICSPTGDSTFIVKESNLRYLETPRLIIKKKTISKCIITCNISKDLFDKQPFFELFLPSTGDYIKIENIEEIQFK